MNFTKNIIGLTGLYCSGKSTVEKYLKGKYGFSIIDIDLLGHEALEEKKTEIIEVFGRVILSGGNVDRKKLGAIVFGERKKLEILNGIVHPYMLKKTRDIIDKSENVNICINAALLFEMGLYEFCSSIIIVKASLFNIIVRGMKRDKRSIFKILRIICTQKVDFHVKKNRKSAEIFYIANDSGLEKLHENVDKIMTGSK